MAMTPTVQVPTNAVDAAGVSASSATRTVANPRNGTIYNPITFAAGVPVWFHRLQDGRYLGVFRTIWNAATASYHASGPQMFSAHTASTLPSYPVIDPSTGRTEGPYPFPGMATADVTVTSAVSRDDYLFILGLNDDAAWVWHYVITRNGGLQLQGQEEVPLGYQLGLHIDRTHLYVYGKHEDGFLARVRKSWARIGNPNDAQNQWEYEGLKGWLTDTEPHAPMAPGTIPAEGPCSVATFKDRWLVTAVGHAAGAYFAEIWTQRTVEQVWGRWGSDVVPLGADADYLGGGAYLQNQLVAVRDALPDGAVAGIPYVTSARVTVSSDQAILTEWSLLTV